MKQTLKPLAALAIASVVAVPAFAGGLAQPQSEPVVAAPVAAPAYTGGEWGGFYAGAQLGYADLDSNGAGIDGNGAIGGIHGGYRWDFGRTVIGAEVDYDTADVSLGNGIGDLNNVARLKFMAGADLGRALVYGTAGVARAEATVAGTDFSDNGYFGGIGVDYALTDTWTVGGELLLHKFKDFDNTNIDLDVTTIKAKVAYRF